MSQMNTKTFNIPTLGFEFELNSQWSFKLYPERRNEKFAKNYNSSIRTYRYHQRSARYAWINDEISNLSYNDLNNFFDKNSESDSYFYELNVTLEIDTKLKVDRIFIRKGSTDFNSLSFYIKSGKYKGNRFWAKLKEVNNINFK